MKESYSDGKRAIVISLAGFNIPLNIISGKPKKDEFQKIPVI